MAPDAVRPAPDRPDEEDYEDATTLYDTLAALASPGDPQGLAADIGG